VAARPRRERPLRAPGRSRSSPAAGGPARERWTGPTPFHRSGGSRRVRAVGSARTWSPACPAGSLDRYPPPRRTPPRASPGASAHATATGRELERVGQEIQDDALDLVRVDLRMERLDVKHDPLLAGEHLEVTGDEAREAREVRVGVRHGGHEPQLRVGHLERPPSAQRSTLEVGAVAPPRVACGRPRPRVTNRLHPRTCSRRYRPGSGRVDPCSTPDRLRTGGCTSGQDHHAHPPAHRPSAPRQSTEHPWTSRRPRGDRSATRRPRHPRGRGDRFRRCCTRPARHRGLRGS